MKDIDSKVYQLFIDNGYSKLSSLVASQTGLSLDDGKGIISVDKDTYELPDIDTLTDCRKAAESLYDIIKNKTGLIIVNSDYDADGVSGGGIIDIFLLYYFNVDRDRLVVLQNERKYGNGFNSHSLRKVIDMFDDGKVIDLLITADHGSRDDDRYKLLPKDIAVIVTDHHTVAKKPMSRPIAFVNPHRHDSTYDDRISGAVVAYLVMLETAKIFKENNHSLGRDDSFELPLTHAGITVLSDRMDLRSPVNRYLLKKTLHLLTNPPKETKWDIFRNIVKVDDIVTTKTIGFTIAPLLNGAGRMGNALVSRKFVRSNDPEELKSLTTEMFELNKSRKVKQNTLMKDSLGQVQQYKKHFKNSLVIKLPEGGGVAGIISGALGEMENRPTFVFTPSDNKLVGSGRAIVSNLSLPDSFEYISKIDDMIIIGGGGHAAAAGLTIRSNKFMDFCKNFDKYVSEQDLTSGVVDSMPYNMNLSIRDVNASIHKYVEELAPYGDGLNAPVFKDTVTVKMIRGVGPIKNHAIMKVSECDIGIFYPNANIKGVSVGDSVTIYYTVEMNRDKPSVLISRLVK